MQTETLRHRVYARSEDYNYNSGGSSGSGSDNNSNSNTNEASHCTHEGAKLPIGKEPTAAEQLDESRTKRARVKNVVKNAQNNNK
ncbi:hypothetical protein AWZ03_000849 [Drosophila navojoa]|uniref:Uncharacterized protein n=1 Tax=Drosophila navojoa TaxID=7232 RepID=A0A484BUX6_DRONA|nr:hypothetical protein AWZ03_000849 [Drosophila navojoa]